MVISVSLSGYFKMAVTGAIRHSLPLQRSSSTEACIIGETPEIKPKSAAATEEVEDGIHEVISFSKSFSKSIAFNVQRDWSIVKSALEEHDISCKLDLVNSSMTFSTTRTKDTDIARKAKDLLQLLSLNIPASRAIHIIKAPNCECEIINTGHSKGGLCTRFRILTREHLVERQKVLKSSIKELGTLTSCDILVGDGLVVAIGAFEGLRIVRKVVEHCIVYSVAPSYKMKIIRMMLAAKKLEDLRL